MDNVDKQVINIRLNPALWRKVKSQSALEGKTATQWVVEALEFKLKEVKQ